MHNLNKLFISHYSRPSKNVTLVNVNSLYLYFMKGTISEGLFTFTFRFTNVRICILGKKKFNVCSLLFTPEC